MMEDSTVWSHQAPHDLLENDIPLQPVTLNGDYAALRSHGVSMMASDWVSPEAIPEVPSPDPAEYARMEESLARLVPAWATSADSSDPDHSQDATKDRPIR